MTDPDSGDLLLVAAGDASALERIVARWKGPVYSIFERTRDAASAAEATADVFDRLRATAPSYEPAMRPEAFLHRAIAERILRDPAAAAEPIPPATLASSAAARSAFVRSAVAALPPLERAAFLLTRVAGLSTEDAAVSLRLTPADLQKHVVHALSLLRAALEPASRSVPALAPVERHFGPQPHDTPPDLDHRLSVRLSGAPLSTARWGRAAALGIGIGGLAVLAGFLLLPRAAAPRRSIEKPAAASALAAGTDPEILHVQSAPVTIDTIPASEAEEAQAAGMFPPAFLQLSDTLLALDPFFPEDAAAELAGPPSPRPTQAPRTPPAAPEELGDRITYLRHLRPDERTRLVELDRAYRLRPEAERFVLWERWRKVHVWTDETLGGLRPLARRVATLVPERRSALALELRALRALPREERSSRFRTLAFAQGLTGQERAAAEALLG